MRSALLTNDAEPTKVTVRRIRLASFVKWQTLAFSVLGILVGIMCTVWYAIAGQLTVRTSAWYFLAVALFYAIPGLVSSIIFCAIYNSVAGSLGGFEFDLVTNDKPIPPPPEHWEGKLPKIYVPETPGQS